MLTARINVREYRRGNHKRTIQKNRQHGVHKTKKNKAKTQHNMYHTRIQTMCDCVKFYNTLRSSYKDQPINKSSQKKTYVRTTFQRNGLKSELKLLNDSDETIKKFRQYKK